MKGDRGKRRSWEKMEDCPIDSVPPENGYNSETCAMSLEVWLGRGRGLCCYFDSQGHLLEQERHIKNKKKGEAKKCIYANEGKQVSPEIR